MSWWSSLFRSAPTPTPDLLAPSPDRPTRRIQPGRARGFAAAEASRLNSTWTGMPQPADYVVRADWMRLVARSRERTMNDDYGRRFVRMVQRNVVGADGITLQAVSRDPNGKLDEAANGAIEAAWRRWSDPAACDVTGRMSWRRLLQTAMLYAARDGEFFVRLVMGSDAGPFGLQLQLLDPVRCPVDVDDNALPGGGFIRHGIEFSAAGRPVAYLFQETSPSAANYVLRGRGFSRVPADEVLHGFVEILPEQKRGLPWMSASLLRMKNLNGFEEAALVNAKANASTLGFIEWDENFGPQLPDENDDGTEREPIRIEVEPGVYQELPAGAKVHDAARAYPPGEFASFAKQQLRAIAAGLDVSYNSLANDLAEVNYSSARQGLLDERDGWRDLQAWLVETLCTPVFRHWLPRALLLGQVTLESGKALPAEKVDKYGAHLWQPRRWQWVDPRADVAAAVTAKNHLLVSVSQVIREQGRDPDSVFREIAADLAAMRAAGIPDSLITAAMSEKLALQEAQSAAPTP